MSARQQTASMHSMSSINHMNTSTYPPITQHLLKAGPSQIIQDGHDIVNRCHCHSPPPTEDLSDLTRAIWGGGRLSPSQTGAGGGAILEFDRHGKRSVGGGVPQGYCGCDPGATKTAEAMDRMRGEDEAMRALGVSMSSSYNSRYVMGVGSCGDGCGGVFNFVSFVTSLAAAPHRAAPWASIPSDQSGQGGAVCICVVYVRRSLKQAVWRNKIECSLSPGSHTTIQKYKSSIKPTPQHLQFHYPRCHPPLPCHHRSTTTRSLCNLAPELTLFCCRFNFSCGIGGTASCRNRFAVL